MTEVVGQKGETLLALTCSKGNNTMNLETTELRGTLRCDIAVGGILLQMASTKTGKPSDKKKETYSPK